MGGVQLEDPAACLDGAPRSLRKCGNDSRDPGRVERLWHLIPVVERDGARRYDGLPAARGDGQRLAPLPWRARTCLPSRVRQLHAGHGPVLRHEAEHAGQHLDVIVLPDAEVIRADAPFRQHRRRLGQDRRRPANRPAAQVDEVPVGGIPVDARVLAHGRNDDAVAEGETADGERREQH